MKRHPTTAIAITMLLAGAVAACDDDTDESLEDDIQSVITEVSDAVDEASEDAVELAVRNFASMQGSQEFETAGYPIEGDLTCEADATNDLSAVEIDCTGTTADGGEASLSGITSELPGMSFDELQGTFVGTVDGDEVFSTERLGS